MSMETIFFIASASIAFMPTFWTIKKDDKNLNWLGRLTTAGRVYILAFIIFFGIGLYLTIRTESNSVKKEIALVTKSKKDSTLRRSERIADSLSRDKLFKEITRLSASKSAFKFALKKGGYSFDSIKGLIISPKNIQVVENGGKAIQNNAPNQGNQFVGDIFVASEKKLTDNDKLQIIKMVKDKINSVGKECFHFQLIGGSNGIKIMTAIIQLLKENNFNVEKYLPIDTLVTSEIINGVMIRPSVRGDCVEIIVGSV